jgi:hypothetical protein
MSEEPARLDAEWIEEGFMQPTVKRITFQCPICDHVWTRTYKAEPANDPPCPNKHCADKRELRELQKQVANLTTMLAAGQGPAHIGANPKVKAVDTTAEIVMADHHLTDLKDSIRPGESMAPKLPVPMQRAADSFFSGGAAALGTGQPMSRMQKRMQALGQRAIAGGMRDMSVAPNQVLPQQRPTFVRQANAGYDGSRPTAEGNGRR